MICQISLITVEFKVKLTLNYLIWEENLSASASLVSWLISVFLSENLNMAGWDYRGEPREMLFTLCVCNRVFCCLALCMSGQVSQGLWELPHSLTPMLP